ncbi:SSI family serine proteinase inhibitor [Actinocorallia sp. A-T 12471]|uniref:SSI family serine proteinase inhibitor n=1 Tax=Actinocorallia sp. A-T 12471 TaxID=3089813 RepID=UPI0029CCA8AE|nr:SSI family serine proteinase inhibitor [Actinocorallia sp. A-T 12471]MDX6742085.1 SSI family serine proteinase inhibitor [Actinocorallia sp. A-T 12471]
MRTSSPKIAAKLLLLTAAVVAAATACGGKSADEQDTASPNAAGPASTQLTITLKKSPSAKEESWTLTCDPAGGTHPAAAKACAQLDAAGEKAFAPKPADAVCTDVYGGPEQGTVTGTFKGKAVDASYSRKDGCEIDRWGVVSELFGELPKVR